MPDGNFTEFPIPYILTDNPADKVDKTTTINGKPLSADVTLTPSDIGAVPTSRTVNNKALSSDITLDASDFASGEMASLEYEDVASWSGGKSIKVKNDTYIDSDGVSITNTGKTLKNFVDGYSGAYTPTFTFTAGTGTVANISMRYVLRGGFLYISGRFQVAEAPSESGYLEFTLPNISGVTITPAFSGGVGTIGVAGKLTSDSTVVTFRIVSGNIRLFSGSGNPLFPALGTGYVPIGVIVPVSIT